MVMLAATELPRHRFDLCIVGMGPAGLTLALEADKHGLSVLLVDAGSTEPSSPTITGDTIDDAARHAPLPLASMQGAGGTSWLWGGRCVPFESIDFSPRNYVPDSGWPCTYDELAPWYDIAANYLDCGNTRFRSQQNSWEALPDIDLSQDERWARQPQLAKRLMPHIMAARNIHVLCNTRITDIVFDATRQSVTSLTASHHNTPVTLHASQYVIACGGIETTRLLLAVQHKQPDLFGGKDGVLGRYYMGHIFGSIASIVLNNPDDVAALDFRQDATGTYVRKRFTLSAQAQETHQLLNTSFYIDNPPFYDASHQNATLSLIFLALRIPAIGRRLITEAIRLRHIGPPPYPVGAHLMNIIRSPLQVIKDVLTILRERYLSPVRKPGFILRNKGGTYALNYHAEQVPHKDSRIHISDAVSDHGLPPLHINFRYQDQDVQSVLQAHTLLDNALRSSGKGYLRYHREEVARHAHIMEQATDGFHQVGTTKMGTDPAKSIVDAQGQVHGINNLHIASSSIFPTTGEANPTLLLAAFSAKMAARLAHQPVFAAPTTHTTITTMKSILLPGTDLRMSKLAFGTASLHHLFLAKERDRLLRAAIDAGFTHFDTSPYYGFGIGEVALGKLPADIKQRITIASKVGLYGPSGASANMASVLTRKIAGKLIKPLNSAVVNWQVSMAQQSLDASLQRLGRDYLDILFLHEPDSTLIQTEEWQAWLASRLAAGQIRHWGIAGEAERIAAMLSHSPSLAPIVQVRDSLTLRQADVVKAQRPLQLTYGYMADNPAQIPVQELLRRACDRNPDGTILVSTRQVERIAVLARSMN